MIRVIFSFVVFLLCVLPLKPQTLNYEGEFSMLKSNNGVLLIYNAAKNSFMLEIHCKDIKEIDAQDMIFLVDGKVLQITPVPITVFYPDEKPISEIQILEKHVNFEVDYAKSVNGEKVQANIKKFDLNKERMCFAWDYRMPKKLDDTATQSVRKQFFLNTKLEDIVLMLSSVATLKDNDKKIQEFLKKTMSSLKTSETNFNIEELRESLKGKK